MKLDTLHVSSMELLVSNLQCWLLTSCGYHNIGFELDQFRGGTLDTVYMKICDSFAHAKNWQVWLKLTKLMRMEHIILPESQNPLVQEAPSEQMVTQFDSQLYAAVEQEISRFVQFQRSEAEENPPGK